MAWWAIVGGECVAGVLVFGFEGVEIVLERNIDRDQYDVC